jgi:hypothetical protein
MLNACTDNGPADMTQAGKQATGAADDSKSVPRPAAMADVTTGDVEQKVFINGTLAPGVVPDNIKVDEVKDPRGKFNLVNLDIYPPFPEHLNLQFEVKTTRNWEGTPLVLRCKATIEGKPEPIGGMEFVWSKDALRTPQSTSIDVMPALQPLPDTVLVAMRADALLMPTGTDATLLNASNATTPEDRTTGLISNPIRINFHKEAAPAASAAQTPQAPTQ